MGNLAGSPLVCASGLFIGLFWLLLPFKHMFLGLDHQDIVYLHAAQLLAKYFRQDQGQGAR